MSRYTKLILSNPSLVIAAFVVRLGCSAMPLAVILLAQERSGSFQFAGLAGAALALGALFLPLQGRFLDLWGPRIVFPAAALLGVPLLLLQGLSSPPLWALLPLALGTSATQPATTSYMRAYWQRSFTDPDLHLAGNALESALTRLLNILGPLLVSGALLLEGLSLIFVGAAALILLGSVVLSKNENLSRISKNKGRLRPSGPLLLIWGAALAAGWTIGVSELLFPLLRFPDFAKSGILFASVGLGYLLGSLWSGARGWQNNRKTILLYFLASLFLFGAGATNILLPLLLLLFGWTGAVAANHLNTLLGQEAPERNFSEAYAWSVAATVIGIALGHVASGPLADNAPAEWMFLLAVLPGAVWTLVARVSWKDQLRYGDS